MEGRHKKRKIRKWRGRIKKKRKKEKKIEVNREK